MNLTKVSAIAEILSSIAVVLTLVLLLIGIKENTEITRVTAYQSIIEQTNSARAIIMSNPQVLETFTYYLQGNLPTEPSDWILLNMILDTQANVQEVAYYAHQRFESSNIRYIYGQ